MASYDPDVVVVTDSDSKEKSEKVTMAASTKLIEDHDKKAISVGIPAKNSVRTFRRHGFEPPLHSLQVLTWVLYTLRQIYTFTYISAAAQNDVSVLVLSLVTVLHVILTIAVVLLAVAATITDGQYSQDEI